MALKALMFNTNRVFLNVPVIAGNTKTTITLTNNLKHSNNIDNTGVPVFDQLPFLNDAGSCYVQIFDVNFHDILLVQSGAHVGEKIIGITNGGASISPNSVEVLFYSVPFNSTIDISNITPYTWESVQPNTIDISYPYMDRLEQLDNNTFRSTTLLSLQPRVYIQNQVLAVDGTLVYVGDGDIVLKL